LEFISKIRYDNGNYVWVNDIKGIMLEHPEKKLVGKNLLGLQDIKGQYIFQSMINICKQKGEGYVYYYWQYPNSTKIYQKESFVKEFKPWGLIVGSGLYLKDE
jgi:methyl-accepting chemotaxis protein